MAWNVTLSNDAAIFDSCDGFETLREAIEWALGRGDRYNIQIDDGSYPELHMCVTGGKLMFDDCGEWVAVNLGESCKHYERS